jgi:hypothetical protein
MPGIKSKDTREIEELSTHCRKVISQYVQRILKENGIHDTQIFLDNVHTTTMQFVAALMSQTVSQSVEFVNTMEEKYGKAGKQDKDKMFDVD